MAAPPPPQPQATAGSSSSLGASFKKFTDKMNELDRKINKVVTEKTQHFDDKIKSAVKPLDNKAKDAAVKINAKTFHGSDVEAKINKTVSPAAAPSEGVQPAASVQVQAPVVQSQPPPGYAPAVVQSQPPPGYAQPYPPTRGYQPVQAPPAYPAPPA